MNVNVCQPSRPRPSLPLRVLTATGLCFLIAILTACGNTNKTATAAQTSPAANQPRSPGLTAPFVNATKAITDLETRRWQLVRVTPTGGSAMTFPSGRDYLTFGGGVGTINECSTAQLAVGSKVLRYSSDFVSPTSFCRDLSSPAATRLVAGKLLQGSLWWRLRGRDLTLTHSGIGTAQLIQLS